MRLRHTVTKKGSCVCDAWLVWCMREGRGASDRTGRGMFQNASSCVYYVLVHQLELSRKPKITVQLHTTPEY